MNVLDRASEADHVAVLDRRCERLVEELARRHPVEADDSASAGDRLGRREAEALGLVEAHEQRCCLQRRAATSASLMCSMRTNCQSPSTPRAVSTSISCRNSAGRLVGTAAIAAVRSPRLGMKDRRDRSHGGSDRWSGRGSSSGGSPRCLPTRPSPRKIGARDVGTARGIVDPSERAVRGSG